MEASGKTPKGIIIFSFFLSLFSIFDLYIDYFYLESGSHCQREDQDKLRKNKVHIQLQYIMLVPIIMSITSISYRTNLFIIFKLIV